MTMLAFFPWMAVRQATVIEPYELVPWSPGGASPAIEAILGSYTDRVGNPVSSATILRLREQALTRAYSDEERAALFEFAGVLGFTALARRTLCGRWGQNYANTSSLALVIQAFVEESPGFIAEVSRRRGGRLTAGMPMKLFQVRIPPHVEHLKSFEPDAALAAAGLSALEGSAADEYAEAIFSFNAANTDSSQVPEQHEVVALVGALERLVGAKGSADDLALKLTGLLGPYLPTDRQMHLARRQAFESENGALRNNQRIISASSLEAWARDLFRVRNAFGHGRRVNDRKSAWRAADHLLLGAHIFPLALVARLAKDGLYQLRDEELVGLHAIPRLLGLREPQRWRLQRGPIWRYAIDAAGDELRFRRAMSALQE